MHVHVCTLFILYILPFEVTGLGTPKGTDICISSTAAQLINKVSILLPYTLAIKTVP